MPVPVSYKLTLLENLIKLLPRTVIHTLVWCGVCRGVVWCGVVWCGLVWWWCGVAWRGVVWCGVVEVWCGCVWCGVALCGVVWFGVYGVLLDGVVWCGVVWFGVVRRGLVWLGVVWCGVVWCGFVWFFFSRPGPRNFDRLHVYIETIIDLGLRKCYVYPVGSYEPTGTLYVSVSWHHIVETGYNGHAPPRISQCNPRFRCILS